MAGKIFRTVLFIMLINISGQSSLRSQTDEECLDCHMDVELTSVTAQFDTVSAYVDTTIYNHTIHKEAEFECVSCHVDIEEIPHEDILQLVDCAICHDGIAEEYHNSLHGYALERGNPNAPDCSSCHGKHNIFANGDNRSLTHNMNLPKTCGVCHSEYGLKKDPEIRTARAVDIYLGSVHGRNLVKGIAAAATCSDCHGTHDLKGAVDIESTVNKRNIPITCSKCHGDIYYNYNNSIHGRALAAGITDTPVCTNCHGEHSIKSNLDPESPTFKMSLSERVCADCHEDPRLIEKYGLASETLKTYEDSYHGMANYTGSLNAATCISCHDSHNVLPSSNPLSTTHPDNVAETCGKCHPDSDLQFAMSYTHASQRESSNPIDRYVRIGYIVIIVLVIGGMIIHNLIILSKFIREKYRFSRNLVSVKRFDRHFIFQHITLTVSFFILAITGFALRFPDSWWVDSLNFMGFSESSRALFHRIGAILLLFTASYHTVYMLLTSKGKKELRDIMLRKRDIKDLSDNMKYHLGRTKKYPDFEKFDYMEKAEYWALLWGTVIMIITGFILWFPTVFTQYMPTWAFKVSETIHYFEAWLATLAIIIWHFFKVMFHPEEYPMNLGWLHGRITENEIRHHYPGWFKQLQKEKQEVNKKGNK